MDEAISNQPTARLGQASKMAAAVLWLCSPGASFVLGVALPDGEDEFGGPGAATRGPQPRGRVVTR